MPYSTISDSRFGFIVAIIFVELGIGLILTTWTAFANDGIWYKVILVVEILFATLILFVTIRQIKFRIHHKLNLKSCVWICGLCSCGTITILAIAYICNQTASEIRDQSIAVGFLGVGIIIMLIFSCKMGLMLYMENTADLVVTAAAQYSKANEEDPSKQYEYMESP
ncbi:hypothetical protein Ocin01_09977 [Orchesella cincta]|uniref:Uncharacterized protein n=1 Tax=Orchesella cincta TaxID=48709 RepID=A0A1D2MV69_ORCCI|nr:hypothetical protein Ocin01_09977 [Orchesella cincta]